MYKDLSFCFCLSLEVLLQCCLVKDYTHDSALSAQWILKYSTWGHCMALYIKSNTLSEMFLFDSQRISEIQLKQNNCVQF